jgi:hypothetical protein
MKIQLQFLDVVMFKTNFLDSTYIVSSGNKFEPNSVLDTDNFPDLFLIKRSSEILFQRQ